MLKCHIPLNTAVHILSVTVQFIGSKVLPALWARLVTQTKQEIFDSIQKQSQLFNNFVNDIF